MSFLKRKPKKEKKPEKIKVVLVKDTDIRKKLGLQSKIPDDKVKYLLERLRGGNPKTWKALGITSHDFDKFGITGYDK